MAAKINYLTPGNKKLDKSILGWSIPPIKTCMNCSDCKKDCYAMKSYRLYPNTKKAWDRNHFLAASGDHAQLIIDQLNRTKNVSAVRIHVSGDFFNQTYLDSWVYIAKMLPNLRFYGYTKVMDLLDFSELVNLPNVNIINSIALDGGINFGDQDRINKLMYFGYKLCPATIKGNNVKCGGDGCTLCQTERKVSFLVH